MIAPASAGPIPGSVSSCALVAVLRSMSRAGRRIGGGATGRPTSAGGAGCADLRNEDALAVDDLGGEVEAVEVGVGQAAARGLDRVDDARAGGERDRRPASSPHRRRAR